MITNCRRGYHYRIQIVPKKIFLSLFWAYIVEILLAQDFFDEKESLKIKLCSAALTTSLPKVDGAQNRKAADFTVAEC